MALLMLGLGAGVPLHASIILHIDANDLSGLTDGASVSSWGGLTQSTENSQPTYRATGMNGNPTVEFDGGDRMNGIDLPATARSIVAVATLDTGANSFAGLISNSNDNLGVRYNSSNTSYNASGNGGNQGDFFNHGNHGGDNTYINGVGAGSFTLDASHVVLANANEPADYSNFMVGYGGTQQRYWLGDVSEIYVFDQTLTSDEIIGVSSIMAARWGSASISATQAQINAGNLVLGVVPEPSSSLLVALGALGLTLRRRR